MYYFLLLLQKKSHFQNIPFVNIFHPDSTNLTTTFINFWFNPYISTYFKQILFYWRHASVETSPLISWHRELSKTRRRVGSRPVKFLGRTPLQPHNNAESQSRRYNSFIHPFFYSYRIHFSHKTSHFTNFWVQKRHRSLNLIRGKIRLPRARVLSAPRKRRVFLQRRKLTKHFWNIYKKLIRRAKPLLGRRVGSRRATRAQARRLLNSSNFKQNVLTKFYRHFLLHIKPHTFFLKKGAKLEGFKVKTLLNLLFEKPLFLLLRKHLFFSISRSKVTKNSRLLQISKPLLKLRSLKAKGILNTRSKYSLIYDRNNDFIQNSSKLYTHPLWPHPSIGLRKVIYDLILNTINRPSEKGPLKFRTIRGDRRKGPRLPRMTNYFSLRTRRFKLGLAVPLFIFLLKKSKNSFSENLFLRRKSQNILAKQGRRERREVVRNKRLGNLLFWDNRLLRKKVNNPRLVKKSFVWKKKNFKQKLKFWRKFKNFTKSRVKSILSLNKDSLNRYIFQDVRFPLYEKHFLNSRNTKARVRQFTWNTTLNPTNLFKINLPNSKVISSSCESNLPSTRYGSLQYRWRRKKRSPRWKRSKRAWYTLQNKLLNKPKSRSRGPQMSVKSKHPLLSFKTLGSLKRHPKLRTLLIRSPYKRRRKLRFIRNLFRRLTHDIRKTYSQDLIRKVSRRRRTRRRRKGRMNQLRSLLWFSRDSQNFLSYRRPTLSSGRFCHTNDSIFQPPTQVNLTTPFKKLFTNRFLNLHKADSFYPERGSTPNFTSLANKHFILSELGFLHLEPFKLSLSPRNFSSLKAIKYSFYDLMFLKRSILKTKKPNYSIDSTSSTSQACTNLLSRFRGTFFASRGFLIHSRNHLNILNPGFNSVLTHEFDMNSLEGEDDYYIRIRRIRFKPGYPRLWREARADFNKAFDLGFRYQHRLTKYLTMYSRYASALKSKFVDLRLKTFLLRVWWVFDPLTSLELTSNHLVFLNGSVVQNPNKILFRGDLIQLVVQLKYYILHRWLLNWYYYKSNRKARLARTKFKRVQQAQMKQRSFLLPNWLLRLRLADLEIPRFVEVDFFSLSAIILYDPHYGSDYQLLDTLDFRFEIYSMYNWKYIT